MADSYSLRLLSSTYFETLARAILQALKSPLGGGFSLKSLAYAFLRLIPASPSSAEPK